MRNGKMICKNQKKKQQQTKWKKKIKRWIIFNISIARQREFQTQSLPWFSLANFSRWNWIERSADEQRIKREREKKSANCGNFTDMKADGMDDEMAVVGKCLRPVE